MAAEFDGALCPCVERPTLAVRTWSVSGPLCFPRFPVALALPVTCHSFASGALAHGRARGVTVAVAVVSLPIVATLQLSGQREMSRFRAYVPTWLRVSPGNSKEVWASFVCLFQGFRFHHYERDF